MGITGQRPLILIEFLNSIRITFPIVNCFEELLLGILLQNNFVMMLLGFWLIVGC